MTVSPTRPSPTWSPESWRGLPDAQPIAYADRAALAAASERLAHVPPLVTSWEIQRLKTLLADAQAGRRFVLQGGDCAERFDDCRADIITNKLKILLQMSLVLVQGLKQPVVRIGRFAGQYAKPRSNPTESRALPAGPASLPSYFGDLVNAPAFEPASRTPDPARLVRAHEHAAMTLNFIRALVDGGFADLHHPEYWDLSFFRNASLSPEHRARYEQMTSRLADGLRLMEALGERAVDDLTRVEFFTSHEALCLEYEWPQTRRVPRREGWYNLSTHLPWLGDRTRDPEGAHAEYLRGIANPVGVKIGPTCTPADLDALLRRLNPADEPGKTVLITRLGAGRAGALLPPLIAAAGARPVLWSCDPMHGNGTVTAGGVKTRSFAAITAELAETARTLRDHGARLGGVHFELTGEDVTECVGGAGGVTEADLSRHYASPCDPRLNYAQSLEMAFILAGILAE